MIAWLVFALVLVVFLTVMAALGSEAIRLFFVDARVDRLCSDTDEDLDARYGGWRD